MNFIQAAALGIVEGITEFLPISSTFHLIYTSRILQIPDSEFVKLFEVVIQSGAILAVLFIYIKELIGKKELIVKLLLSFLPTAIVGLTLYRMIKDVFFESDAIMMGVFVLVGIVFIIYESVAGKKEQLTKSIKDLSYKEAITIGFIQSLAVVPGVSRAGSVILGMMVLRFRRDEAARYSFFLSVPTIFAASAYDAYKMRDLIASSQEFFPLLVVGFVTAFISALIVVRWLIGYLQRHTLTIFGFYRIILGIILLLYFAS
jgi:undecaprenyl-diphosphatase